MSQSQYATANRAASENEMLGLYLELRTSNYYFFQCLNSQNI